MKNLVGPEEVALWPAITRHPRTSSPTYTAKTEARPGRKMGHVTRLFPHGALPDDPTIQTALPSSRESA